MHVRVSMYCCLHEFSDASAALYISMYTAAEQEHWVENDAEIDEDMQELLPPLPSEDEHVEDHETKAVVWWIVAFVSLFQTLHCISDQAISWLIRFLYCLLRFFAQVSPQLLKVAQAFPRSLYLRDKYLYNHGAINLKSIRKYIVCPKCHSLYSYEEAREKVGSKYVSKACQQKIHSRFCGTQLLKEVVSSSGTVKLYPHKVYCYNGIIATIEQLLQRPNFADLCESTRGHTDLENGSEVLSDIYQGNIWKEFIQEGDNSFSLSSSYTYGLMINVDWFQPFQHFPYSVGVIYFSVLNLPRNVRYKRENIILAGVIPGPSEPSLNINSYLSPLVLELLQLWDGVSLCVHGSNSKKLVRAALLGTPCDLPAGRKVCGFLSHSANLGCSRCYCSFSEGVFGHRNYSDFNRENWEHRSNEKHRTDVGKVLSCRTKTEQQHKESELGCRYTALLNLPYFDPVRMLMIDPMHNLFLGTSKHVTQHIWIAKNILSTEKLTTIHKRLQNVQLPVDIGRLPTRINSGATFTAEQWMNWTIYFSIYCLYGLLTSDEMECWRHFVLACRRLCKRNISQDDITIADGLLLRFCKRIARIYGADCITPNMHMHCHLAECIKDFGPLHAFWLFSFERYNGLLGNQPNNNRSIEMQLLHRFVRDNSHLELLHTADSVPLQEVFSDAVTLHARKFESTRESENSLRAEYFEPPKYTLAVLNSDCTAVLERIYSEMHQQAIAEGGHNVPASIRKFQYIQMNGKKLSSQSEGTFTKTPYVLAKPFFNFNSASPGGDVRPALIQYFFRHSFNTLSEHISHLFAAVRWPMVHPQRQAMGKPVEVWCKGVYEPSIENGFLPVENIVSRAIVSYDTIDVANEQVLVVIPIVQ